MAENSTAQIVTLPPPTGGWDTKSNIVPFDPTTGIGMLPNRAIRLKNWIPEESGVTLRKGCRVHTTGGMGGVAVKTLAHFSGKDGTRKMIACGNGNIYNVTSFNANGSSLKGGLTENSWQWVNYNNKLIMVNGVDQPQQIDSTPSASDAVYTGIADDAKLVNVSVFKNHLYFCELGEQKVWYVTAAGAATGALSLFTVGDFLSLGGFPIYAGPVTQNLDGGFQDYFAVVSSMGEVLIYSGTYPGGTWGLTGRYLLGEPLGRRACSQVKGELIILTQNGPVPILAVINNGDITGEDVVASDNVDSAFLEAAQRYGDQDGWQAVYYHKRRLMLVNIPLSEFSQHQQFGMNLKTRGWCEITGWNACSWAVFDRKLYFGGTDGKVYEADYGMDDNGASIDTEIQWAYNYCGDRESIKHFTNARPLMQATGDINFKFGVNVDFQQREISGTVSVVGTGGTPWGSPWGSPWSASTTNIDDWRGLEANVGRCASLVMKGSFRNVQATIAGVDLMYTPGGVL